MPRLLLRFAPVFAISAVAAVRGHAADSERFQQSCGLNPNNAYEFAAVLQEVAKYGTIKTNRAQLRNRGSR
jgi:hypothetical protein